MKNEYYFNKLIIGGSIESLLYSFTNQIPIILKDPIVPFELEKMNIDDKFDFLGYTGIREVYKSELWDRLTFLLSMNGILLMPNIIKNIRSAKNSFVISTTNNTRITIKYGKKIDFDKTLKTNANVYDWFDVRSGSVHSCSNILDNKSRFVKKIYFYPSKRIGQTKLRKDLVTYSKIPLDKITNYEYSESYARLKTLKMMKDHGIRGRPNGYNKRGLRLHYAINIEHSHREIINDYKPLHTVEEILQSEKKKGDLWISAKKLFRHKLISTSQGSSRLRDYV